MAIKGNKGNQFVTLYRGLMGVSPEEVGQKGLGSHWTADPHVAYGFATDEFAGVDDPEREDVDMTPGTVIQAKVHKRHIIDPESEEGEGWVDFHGVLGPGHYEQEHTVRPGAIVHVQKMSHVDDRNERLVTPKSRRGWRA